MTPEIRYVTRCSYCHNQWLMMQGNEVQCSSCGKTWTPEMVKITTEKVDIEK